MGSITAKINSISVGGRLVAFFKCVGVYFVVWPAGGGGGGEAPPSLAGLAAKCAPILCLLALVLAHQATLPRDKGRYARRVAAGLALSALGDALVSWPGQLASGMAAFGAAHGAYSLAFGWGGALSPAQGARGAAWALGAAAYCACVRAPGALGGALPVYAAALSGAAWRACERGGAAALGALLFVASDAVLGYTLFVRPLPYQQVAVMSTYYLAQLGIAVSALRTR